MLGVYNSLNKRAKPFPVSKPVKKQKEELSMKKILGLVLAMVVLFSCSAMAEEWVWDRDIEWVCMYDPGSGTDLTLRALY